LCLKSWAFEHVADQPVQLDPHRPGDKLPPHRPVVIVPYVLHLQLTTNTGAVFGMGNGGHMRMVFITISLIAVVVILYLFLRCAASVWLTHIFLALILAGALGNLYDRIIYAQVRDMLHLLPDLGLWPWIFNLADAALMIGVGGIFLTTWRHSSH
jgi:signal peptidase II